MCEPVMPDVVTPEAHQNDCNYVSEFSGPIFDSICTNFMVGRYTEDLKSQQNSQNWPVCACVGMGACPGQYGIYTKCIEQCMQVIQAWE